MYHIKMYKIVHKVWDSIHKIYNSGFKSVIHARMESPPIRSLSYTIYRLNGTNYHRQWYTN